MKLIPKRCHTCGALGVGPKAVKLWPFEERMFCKTHYQDPLTWHESRGAVIRGIESEYELVQDLKRRADTMPQPMWDWSAWISENAGMAEFGLVHGDKKIFVRYFARAVWAWALSQEAA